MKMNARSLKTSNIRQCFLSGTSTDITPSVGNTDTLNVDILLDKERKLNKKEPWRQVG